jgi:hypothetical protein
VRDPLSVEYTDAMPLWASALASGAVMGSETTVASKQIDVIFNALSRADVTASRPSWLDVFCGEAPRLIAQCVN